MDRNVFLLSTNPEQKNKALYKTLDSAGFSVTVIDGVVPSKLEINQYHHLAEIHLQRFGHLITPTELCCVLGHLKIWKKVCQLKLPAIILEEDAILNNIQGLKDSFDQWKLSNSLSILYLGGMDGWEDKIPSLHLRSNYYSKSIGSLGYIQKYMASNLVRTVSYAVNTQSAQSLIDLFEETPFVADRWDFILDKINFLHIYYLNHCSHPVEYISSIEKSTRTANHFPFFGKTFPTFPTRIKGLFKRTYSKITKKII